MDRKQFLETMCRLGLCGCVATVVDPRNAPAAAQSDAPDQRLAFARYQVANLVRFMEAGPAAPACAELIQQTGRECAKLGGLATKFVGDPEGYFAASHAAWGTDFAWDKARGVVTVSVAEGPCGCPLVSAKRTPAFWCHCSVGFQKEAFSTVFGRPVDASLKASKLSGASRCVFEVEVGRALP